MIHHYGSDDPILQSLPLFVNLLLEFSIHSADPSNTVDLPSDPFENTSFSDILDDLDSTPDDTDNFNTNNNDENSIQLITIIALHTLQEMNKLKL
ncbi:unnamed protein product [[Candida] boidinii]|nr:unnamed protein product [[Candida] boidinii]